MNDTISTQEAIDILIFNYPSDRYKNLCTAFDMAIKALSVRPEQLSDKEQRIFLAAMSREEKVCKAVDEEWRDCREPYEDSLVNVCSEITRKVKGALWAR